MPLTKKDPFRSLLKWWAEVDSNHRTLAGTDLQSVAFSHSAIYPLLNCLHSDKEICLRRDLNPWPLPYQGSALPLRYEGADYKRMPKIVPKIGIEPTTYGLQNRCSTIEPLRHRIIILRTC